MENLGMLSEVEDLREVWPHEALDFTPWLTRDENIALLSDALGLDLIIEESESSVGDFKADILAREEDTGRTVIIENQLTDTDHDHLGKLITYASGKAASVVVWITKRAREEHRAAIEWLNNNTTDAVSFFLCEVKLYKIGDSLPAVKFDIIEKPNDWARLLKDVSSNVPARQLSYEY